MKENIQERELLIYRYNCNSNKSRTSVLAFTKSVVYNAKAYKTCSEQVMFKANGKRPHPSD